MDFLERQEEMLEQELAEGVISRAEFNREVRDLYRDYQAAAEEAAQEAYDREMLNW